MAVAARCHGNDVDRLQCFSFELEIPKQETSLMFSVRKNQLKYGNGSGFVFHILTL